MRGAALTAVALAVFSLVCGCAAPIKSVPPLHEAPARSLRSSSVITLKDNGTEISGRASVFVKAPASLRVEVYGPLGGVAALIIYNGEHLYVYSDGIGKTYGALDLGSALPLHPEILVSALTGDTRWLNDLAKTPGGAEGVSYSVEAPGKDGLKIGKYVDGTLTASAHLDNFKEVDGAVLPFSIVIADRKTGRVITIEHSRVEIDQEPPPAAFIAPSPAAPSTQR